MSAHDSRSYGLAEQETYFFSSAEQTVKKFCERFKLMRNDDDNFYARFTSYKIPK